MVLSVVVVFGAVPRLTPNREVVIRASTKTSATTKGTTCEGEATCHARCGAERQRRRPRSPVVRAARLPLAEMEGWIREGLMASGQRCAQEFDEDVGGDRRHGNSWRKANDTVTTGFRCAPAILSMKRTASTVSAGR